MVSGGKVDKTRPWAIHHLGKHGVKWRVEGKDNIICLLYATFHITLPWVIYYLGKHEVQWTTLGEQRMKIT